MNNPLAQKCDDAAGGHDAGPDGEHGVGKPPSKQRRNQRARPCACAGQGNGDEKIEPQKLRAFDAGGFGPTPLFQPAGRGRESPALSLHPRQNPAQK